MNQKSGCKTHISFITIALLFAFLLLNQKVFSQTQTKQKDIDILYEKYKELDTVIVTNANGNVKLGVNISLNSKGRPESIVLTGYVDNSALANSLVDKLVNDKKKTGYKYSGYSTVYSALEISNVYVYTKGTQYAKYGVDTEIFDKNDDPPPYTTGTDEQKKTRLKKHFFVLRGGCFVYMEVGDISRKLNEKSENFKF